MNKKMNEWISRSGQTRSSVRTFGDLGRPTAVGGLQVDALDELHVVEQRVEGHEEGKADVLSVGDLSEARSDAGATTRATSTRQLPMRRRYALTGQVVSTKLRALIGSR